ncbi:MAG: hypothetical protein NVSMB59_04850 [Vulcanimicrobiaceae bacterium]
MELLRTRPTTMTAYYDYTSGVSAPKTVARLLGRFEVRCAGIRVDTRLSSHARTLLAYLLMHRGEMLRRDRLAYRLWPDLGESDARTMLRRTLFRIARALPPAAEPWLACDAKTVTWRDADGSTWVDAPEFDALCASDDSLEEAVQLYGGDFAPSLDHEWATEVRDRLRARSTWALDELMTRYAQRHDMRGALRYSEALLEIDPWREDALCNTMLFRYRLGDRAGSLWIYHTFCGRLHREFGVDPMPMTQRCFEAIVAGAPL